MHCKIPLIIILHQDYFLYSCMYSVSCTFITMIIIILLYHQYVNIIVMSVTHVQVVTTCKVAYHDKLSIISMVAASKYSLHELHFPNGSWQNIQLRQSKLYTIAALN